MRVLMIGGDKNALDTKSALFGRLSLQSEECEWLEVLTVGGEGKIPLGERGVVRGFSGKKARVALRMIAHGKNLKDIDIVTVQDPFFLGLVGWGIASALKKPLHMQVHTDVFSPAFSAHSFKNKIEAALARSLLKKAGCIRVVSSPIKNSLEKRGIRAPISVLPIFTDTEKLSQAPAHDLKKMYPQFKRHILIASRLEPEKKLTEIFEMMKEVLKEVPESGLLIAGAGSDEKRLKDYAHDAGIEKNVVFLGYRHDIASFYKSADLVFASTAPFEGYGAGIVEALYVGSPVVSLNEGVAKEAGATIAEKGNRAHIAIRILKSGERGKLLLSLPSKEEYARLWRASMKTCLNP